MSFDYSFRINDRMYGINNESLASTLGDFIDYHTITFSNQSERLGTNGVMFFLADHDQFGEACYRFICPYLINLVKLINRDLIAVDFLFDEKSDDYPDLVKDAPSRESIVEEAFIAKLTSDPHGRNNNFSNTLGALLDSDRHNFYDAERLINSKPYFSEALSSNAIRFSTDKTLYIPITTSEAIKIKSLNKNSKFVHGEFFSDNLLGEKNTKLIYLESIPELREIEQNDKFSRVGSSVSIRSFAQHFCNEVNLIREMILHSSNLHCINSFSIRDAIYIESLFPLFKKILISMSAELVFEGLEGEKIIPIKDGPSIDEVMGSPDQELLVAILIPKFDSSRANYGKNKESQKISTKIDIALHFEQKIMQRLLLG